MKAGEVVVRPLVMGLMDDFALTMLSVAGLLQTISSGDPHLRAVAEHVEAGRAAHHG